MKRGSEVRLPSHLGHGSLSLFVRKAPNSAVSANRPKERAARQDLKRAVQARRVGGAQRI